MGAAGNERDELIKAEREIKKLREALAQTQQEPVAHFGSAYVNENGVHITTILGPVAIPQDAKLYTSQPARKPLDDNQINHIYGAANVQHDHIPHDDVVRIVRATEAMLNAK